MRYIALGRTGMDVSRVAFGTWSFGGEWGAVDEEDARAAVHRALDLGVTLFDTAQGYGFGRAERLLAGALGRSLRSGEALVATKGGLRRVGDDLVRDNSPGWLREGVEASLRNLGVEAIDLYQVHWPDLHTPPDETAAALEELVREGKIRHVGVSNYSVKQLDELASHGPVETEQPPYDMFRREIEAELLPYAKDQDLGVLVYGPLAHGLLSGRMTTETTFGANDWRSHSPDFTGEGFRQNLRVVEELRSVAQARRLPLPTLAVAWTLSHPAVHVAIVGGRRPAHLDATVAAADVDLTRADRDEIGRILAAAEPMHGPSPEGM
jgi:aryl-alcohol dehydrogenase-like predicted oxidoreductase